MNHYINAFKTEWQKLKHSGTFWICFGASAFVPLIQTLAYFFADIGNGRQDNDIWNTFIKTNFSTFTGFFFPIFMVIIVARVVYLEHRSDTWKLLETQPVPRLSLFLGKWQISMLISFLCLLGVLLFALIGGFVLQLFKPKSGFDKSTIDWIIVLKAICRYWIASFGFIAIQYFLGLWNKSFALPLSAGLVATIAGSILAGFGIWTWWPYSAPSYTSATFSGSLTGQMLMHQEKMSILWAILFLTAGYQLFVRKSFVKAVFVPITRLLSAIFAIIIFIGIAYYINKPVELKRYTRTVIAGHIKSEKPVLSLVVLRQPAFDTILNIPVVDGNFHGVISESIDAGFYSIGTSAMTIGVFFGNNDSTYLELDANKLSRKSTISGTRIAENEYEKKNDENFALSSLTNFPYDYKPEEYANQLLDIWEDGLKDINSFKTADNIMPAQDFRKVQEKLLAIRLLKLAEVTYPQVFNLYNPNDKYQFPKKLDKLKAYANINDNDLVSYGSFTDYMYETIRSKSGSNDSTYFALVENDIKNQQLKDVLYFKAINGTLSKLKDSAFRNYYLNRIIPFIKNDKFKNKLYATNNRFNNLQRGKLAYIFKGEALNGAEMILAQLANRYVVIDVWATWCGPCTKESPFFEELAEKYTSDKVSFMALSIDEDKKAWQMKAPYKSKKVIQLLAKNEGETFTTAYAISTIPRFMLIDPEGRIVDTNLPPPSNPEFENILNREIPFLADGNFNRFKRSF